MSLPWPAESFLTDSAVRLALTRRRPELIAFVVLFASASWLEDDGTLPDDPERLAASVGLEESQITEAVRFWVDEGKLKREDGRLWLPWLTRQKAASNAAAEARSEQAKVAANARWAAPRPGENLSLIPAASDGHAPGKWPKDYTTPFCTIWVNRWGSGSAPGDVIGSCLRQIKKGGAPFDAVLRSFERYVDKVDEKFASPQHWRKGWKSYDPEEPEHDHEAAEVADSWDRQLRQRHRGGMRPALPESEKRGGGGDRD